MRWQPVELEHLHAPRRAEPLDIWWWPEANYPPAANRRQRTDTVLRSLLAPDLSLSPEQLRFGREEHGRPFLQHERAPDFNLSDTAGGTVVAIAAHGRVGVDIERRDRSLPVLRLAERWFAPEEAQRLREMDGESARRAFLNLWTAKEAACKATGTGIFGLLPAWRFAVGDDDSSPQLAALPTDAGAPARWCFHRLAPQSTHTVVIACRDVTAPPRGFIMDK